MSLTYITLLMPAFALLIPPAHLTDAPSPAYRTLYYRLKRLLIHILTDCSPFLQTIYIYINNLFKPVISVYCFSPGHLRCKRTRLVSCYAFFK